MLSIGNAVILTSTPFDLIYENIHVYVNNCCLFKNNKNEP